MADTPVGGVTAFAGQCLAWVQRELNLTSSIWNGQGGSAASAFLSMSGSQKLTSNPQPGDIVLYPRNSGSGNGHAGIYAGGGNVISVLNDGVAHLIDLATLNGYEGNSSPIFVNVDTMGAGVRATAQAAIATLPVPTITGPAAPGQPGSIDPASGNVIAGPPGPGQPGSPATSPGAVTGTQSVSSACGPPQAFNFPVMGPWISWYGCVIGHYLLRGGAIVLGLVIVGIGMWIYATDKNAPGAKGLQTVGKSIPNPTLGGNVRKVIQAPERIPTGQRTPLSTLEKRAQRQRFRDSTLEKRAKGTTYDPKANHGAGAWF